MALGCGRRDASESFRYGVVRSGGATRPRVSAMALGCRRREAAAQAARGDETVDRPCLRQPLQPGASTGGHTAFDRRLSVAPRSMSSMWRRRSGSKQGSDPRRSPLREVSWGWSHASDADETRRPRALGGKEIDDGHRAAAREKRCPTFRNKGTRAQQHARAATSQQPSRRVAPASTPQRCDPQRCMIPWPRSTWRRRWASA